MPGRAARPGPADRLIDGDDLGPGRASHCHGPLPADVAVVEASEEVRDDTISCGLDPQVVPDKFRAYPDCPAEAPVPWYRVVRGGQRLTGQVNGLRAELIWLLAPAADGAHDCQFSLL